MRTVFMLALSNTFMNIAWYGHLKFRDAPTWLAILISWLIALPEYSLAVPANRCGKQYFTLPQLKMMQEVLSVGVFVVITTLMGEIPTKRDFLALMLIGCGVAVAVSGRAVSG